MTSKKSEKRKSNGTFCKLIFYCNENKIKDFIVVQAGKRPKTVIALSMHTDSL